MIFKVPPNEPCSVVKSESDYIIWTIEENDNLEDSFDEECVKIANQYPGKTFIALKLSCAQDFAVSHQLDSPEMLIRVKDCQIVFSAYNPMTCIIQKQAKLLGVRKGSVKYKHMSSQETKTMFKGGEHRNLKICEDGSSGTNIAKIIDQPMTSGIQLSSCNSTPPVKLIHRRSLNTLNRDAEVPTTSTSGCFPTRDMFKRFPVPSSEKLIPNINIYSSYSNAKTSATNFIRRASVRLHRRSQSSSNYEIPPVSVQIKSAHSQEQLQKSNSSTLTSETKLENVNSTRRDLETQKLIPNTSRSLFEAHNPTTCTLLLKHIPKLEIPHSSISSYQSKNDIPTTSGHNNASRNISSKSPVFFCKPQPIKPRLFVADVNIAQPVHKQHFIVYEMINPFPKPTEKACKCMDIKTLVKPSPEEIQRLRYIRERQQNVHRPESLEVVQKTGGKAKFKSRR